MRRFVFVFHEWDLVYEQKKHPTCTKKIIQTERARQGANEFGMKLQTERIRRRMTIEEVAAAVEMDPKSIMLFENGSETPGSTTKNALQKQLHMQ